MEVDFLNKDLEELYTKGRSKKYKDVSLNIAQKMVKAVEVLKTSSSGVKNNPFFSSISDYSPTIQERFIFTNLSSLLKFACSKIYFFLSETSSPISTVISLSASAASSMVT